MPVNVDIADDLIGYAVNLQRFSAKERKFALTVLRQLERDLSRELRAVDPTGVSRTRYQQARLNTLLRQTRTTIRNAYGAVSRKVDADMVELAELTSESVTNIVNAGVKFDVMTTAVTPSLLRTIAKDTLVEGSKSATWWARQAGDTRFRFENAMRQGVLRGETVQQLGQRVRDIFPASRRNAEGLARTVVVNVSNEAALQTFKENDDVIEAIEWLSTLDSRTTPICRALDGLKWDLDGKPIGHDKVFPGPTAHWACRSTQIPVLYEADKFPPAKRKGANKVGTRASKDGQVSANLDYDSWLKRRTKREQIEILGPGRWDLWSRGKLTQREFTDSLNRPLTLAELRKKYGGKKAAPKPRPKPAPVPITEPKKPTLRQEKTLSQAEIGRQRVDAIKPPIDKENGEAMLAHYQALGRLDTLRKPATADKALEKARQTWLDAAVTYSKSSEAGDPEEVLAKLKKAVKDKEVGYQAAKEAAKKTGVESDLNEIYDELFGSGKESASRYVREKIHFAIGKRRGSFAARDTAVEATTRFSQMFGGWMPPELKKVGKRSRRASADLRGGSIDIGGGSPRATFHEIGHHVEYNNRGIFKAAEALRKAKASSDRTKPLRSITGNRGYNLREVAYPGDYINPYAGKVYPDSWGNVTEIVSMGLEQFADKERMINFAKQQPDHFEFILGLIRAKRYE